VALEQIWKSRLLLKPSRDHVLRYSMVVSEAHDAA